MVKVNHHQSNPVFTREHARCHRCLRAFPCRQLLVNGRSTTVPSSRSSSAGVLGGSVTRNQYGGQKGGFSIISPFGLLMTCHDRIGSWQRVPFYPLALSDQVPRLAKSCSGRSLFWKIFSPIGTVVLRTVSLRHRETGRRFRTWVCFLPS